MKQSLSGVWNAYVMQTMKGQSSCKQRGTSEPLTRWGKAVSVALYDTEEPCAIRENRTYASTDER